MNSIAFKKNLILDNESSQIAYREIIEQYRSGQMTTALDNALRATEKFPLSPDLWKILGVISQDLNRGEGATAAFRQAVVLSGDDPVNHSNLALALYRQGQMAEAILSLQRVAELDPSDADAHYNLGVLLKESGRFKEAITAYRRALNLNPEVAEAFNNLGILLCEQGRLGEGIDAYKMALSVKPNYWEALLNLGTELQKVHFASEDRSLYPCLEQLLNAENMVAPADVAPAILSLLKHDPILIAMLREPFGQLDLKTHLNRISKLEQLPLLQKLMRLCPLPDLALERVFTGIRSVLLEHVSSLADTPFLESFQATLSLQCFLNEYVYFETERDRENVAGLQRDIERNLAAGKEPEVAEVLCLSLFRPLHRFHWSEDLSSLKKLPEIRERLITQPLTEHRLAGQIRTLGPISNDVSIKVKRQYEENPYPRWAQLGVTQSKLPVDEYLKGQGIRHHSLRDQALDSPRILVAGCGTGQHALQVALRHPESQVLAVDLSRASLSYAQRQANRLGVTGLEFMQGDILDLAKLGEDFDIIESIGVLHHMDDPSAGWAVLTELLRPSGLMKIGLYSELARKDIVTIREEIVALGLQGCESEIRAFRHQIAQSTKSHYKKLALSKDFFSLSELRDAIFHIQEHRFTIPQLAGCLESLNLQFCGFTPNALNYELDRYYGGQADCHDLHSWHQFEVDHPDTFRGMYQFWCQKAAYTQ
ncbi:MAG: tetratricopeptide repeat protein [Halieaceae bacterium]|nr:tetratricopeptide repeat protein [Halieaceae bacterium]